MSRKGNRPVAIVLGIGGAVVAAGAPTAQADPPRYRAERTGLVTHPDGELWRINGSGSIVGSARYVDGLPVGDAPVVWDATNGARLLLDMPTTQAHAHDINERGEVVGWYYDRNNPGQPYRSFYWSEASGAHELAQTGSGDGMRAWAISDFGRITGEEVRGSENTAVQWDQYASDPAPFAGLSQDFSRARETDRSRYTVGVSEFYLNGDNDLVRQAFLAAGGNVTRLGSLAADGLGDSYAYATNDWHDVVGFSQDDIRRERAFIWDPNGGMRPLAPLTDERSYAYDINNGREIVGRSGSQAVYWFEDEAWLLHDLLVDAGDWLSISHAWGINDAGEIVAQARPADGGPAQVVVLRVVPGPGSLGLLAGFGLLAPRRRR
jgi:uncharacterized membrane protein